VIVLAQIHYVEQLREGYEVWWNFGADFGSSLPTKLTGGADKPLAKSGHAYLLPTGGTA
jgi:hypothetical protein